MKKTLLVLLACFITSISFATNVFQESFEYANHDLTPPIGWTCVDQSWLCGYLDKDHNRTAHTGDWYAFTNADESWMFMPLFLSSELRYRFSYWAISDGSFDVEFWAGTEDNPGHMSQLLFSTTVSGDEYEAVSAYVESIASNYQYFGIHAVATAGAYHLTIDDINVDMVNKYDMEVTPVEIHATLNAGEEITIEYDVQNTGYEDLHIYMTPYTDFFSDIHFTEDGLNYSSFPTVPNQIVHCTCSATLLPNLTPGTLCWMDIMFTVSCDCVTRMATLWVTVADPTETTEVQSKFTLFPNPANDHVIIDEKGLQQVELIDMSGKMIHRTITNQDKIRLDLTTLKPGIYVVKTVSERGVSTRKLIME